MASPSDAPSSSSGAHAISLIQQSSRKLVHLQPAVLADRDPEPLHQMRVSMRRLRTCLRQFGPALQLPGSVTDRRIAKVARRLGMARDLDVLRDRLQNGLIPRLPEPEAQALRPVLKQLRRERSLAYEELVKVLQSGSYLELLAKLQRWLKKPRLTPLGEEPLGDWLLEWQAPLLVSLFLHPGWFVTDLEGDMDAVHDLRKQCKTARYALENLAPCTGMRCRSWARRFQRFQELLGELNDLQVLQQAIDDQLPGRLADSLPQLHTLLQVNAHLCWRQWRVEAEALQGREQRHRLLQALLGEAASQQLHRDLDLSLISS
jgi:CHAD domain-containing protein